MKHKIAALKTIFASPKMLATSTTKSTLLYLIIHTSFVAWASKVPLRKHFLVLYYRLSQLSLSYQGKLFRLFWGLVLMVLYHCNKTIMQHIMVQYKLYVRPILKNLSLHKKIINRSATSFYDNWLFSLVTPGISV